MSIHEELDRLLAYGKMHTLYPPLLEKDFQRVKSEFDFDLPKDLVAMLQSFDGGELFKRGIIIYGFTSRPNLSSIIDANCKIKRLFSIPKSYIVFGRLNFGDLLCINTDSKNDVIEWDHEKDELFCSWDSLAEMIHEEIDFFEVHSAEGANEN